MTASFDEAVKLVLVNEGGLTDDPRDKGGTTNYGITKVDLFTAIADGIVPHGTTIVSLTKPQAIDIYKELYWDKLKLDKILTQSIANKILDVSVNLGLRWGVIVLQRAIRSAAGLALVEDGILGPKTLEAVNLAPAATLLAAYRSEQASYYRCVVNSNHSQECFFKGWLNRAYDLSKVNAND